jgi:hypothetical protein
MRQDPRQYKGNPDTKSLIFWPFRRVGFGAILARIRYPGSTLVLRCPDLVSGSQSARFRPDYHYQG